MIQSKTKGIIAYVFFDWLSAIIAWVLLFSFRKSVIQHISYDYSELFEDQNFVLGIIIIPLAWVLFYFITGTYTDIFRKSRVKAFVNSLWQTALGVIFIFFTLLLDDEVTSYQNYYHSFFFLFFVHFTLTLFFREVILTIGKVLLEKGKHKFPTLIIGSNHNATEFYTKYSKNKSLYAYNFVGFIEIDEKGSNGLKNYLSQLGSFNDIEKIIADYKIEEVVIAIESSEHNSISHIINILSGRDLFIKIIPDMFDILSGTVKMNQIGGTPLIEIYPEVMFKWQQIVKRLIDLFVSGLSILVLMPVLIFIALKVRFSSEGPIFYKQKRVGFRGKEFNIFKFRSMFIDAEKNGPALSSDDDARITPWGKTMRKWRLDELPQFWNVLIGDMTLIGPRPERQFFLKQMEQKAPHCRHLQRVKPGLSSLGMVKYGYAENVDEMIERLKYDIIYIENNSLSLDFKIMVYTVVTLLRGRGK